MLEYILNFIRNKKMTSEEKEAQRQSFAYGNVKLHNDKITREMISKCSQDLDEDVLDTDNIEDFH